LNEILKAPIAIDAMGGDTAPAEPVRGAVEYSRENGRGVVLVGRRGPIEDELGAIDTAGADVSIVEASEVVSSEETLATIRSKRDSSIRVGVRLVRDGEASALVSAGHTGAMMALSKVVFGVLPGVDRPALPAPLPRRTSGHTILLDAGANVDCKAEHFLQFAVMGADYARHVFNIDDPRVALLSIGEEESKGSDLLFGVSKVLRATSINFIGNVEGNDLWSDRADVVVCDGFVGNIALKVAEGLAEAIYGIIKDEVESGSLLNMLGALAMRPAFRSLKKRIDYAETGGVPLLGLKGISVVAHGRSNARAIKSAMRVADRAAAQRLVEVIGREIAGLHEAEKRISST
jgi:glycerol-3-phosphate acyltransferase PlsX